MIEKIDIIMESRFGKDISNLLLMHSAKPKSLAVLFPGGNNTTFVPVLHYARKAALLAGCDIISLEYGYGIDYHTLSNSKMMNDVAADCLDAINRCLDRDYPSIFFISKSTSTIVAGMVARQLTGKKIKHIFYTPIMASVPYIDESSSLVISGTKDAQITDDDIEHIRSNQNVRVELIANAVHSLEIDNDYKESLRILEHVTDLCADFISKNMGKA